MDYWMTDRPRSLRRTRQWSLSSVEPLEGVTLLAHLETLVPATGRGPLPDGGEPLPDEPPRDPATARLSPGMEAIMSGPGGSVSAPLQAAAAVLDTLRGLATTVGVHTLAARLTELTGPSDMDRLLASVVADRQLDRQRLSELGRWLCRHGTNRWQVKAGIAMLSVSGGVDDVELVTRLGLLEELTLYAVVAIRNLLPDADQAILDLAKQVEGWGRIHAIYRLKGSTDPTVCHWLLRGGYRNNIMTEEVAFIAATTGNLAAALQEPVDDELLDCAGELLAALATGGPAEDLTDYADADRALTAYLDDMITARATLTRLRHLHTLDCYLADDSQENEHLSEVTRARLSDELIAILNRSDWRRVVEAALSSKDVRDVKSAVPLTARFGIDPVPVVRQLLANEPRDGYLWQTLLYAANREGVRELVALAETTLPFDALPRGPARDLGLGPDYRANGCFDLILQRLRAFPGEGWQAIRIGLDSRVTRTRHMALRALDTWPREQWPPDAHDAVAAVAWRDPDTQVKERARALIDPS